MEKRKMCQPNSECVLKDAATLLERAIQAVHTKNISDIERISNETIHNASIYQDPVSIHVAVLTFSIFKLEQKADVKSLKLDLDIFAKDLTMLHDLVLRGKIKVFEEKAKKIFHDIEQMGRKVHQFNLIDRSGVKKGGKLYDHGISVAQAASALQVSQWELYSYIGRSHMNDYPEDVDKRVAQRLAYTRKLFNDA